MADRAGAFASRLAAGWRATVVCRRGSRAQSVKAFAAALAGDRPAVTYVMDMGADAVTAGLLATYGLEELALRTSDHIVVRGSYHRELLARRRVASTFVPDGVDLDRVRPVDGSHVRRRLGLDDALVVGLVGSSMWSPRLEIAYGWDLVELLGLVRDLPVRGLLIGDGSGVERLAARARELGIADRLVFAGRQPLAELPQWLGACDVCLSTQTNDVPGRVRTTGKLPLYLASGRYVLASRVGEAARILPDEMLVPYEGSVDRDYPVRLAERIRHLHGRRERLATGAQGRVLARRHFDYDLLARRLDGVLSGRERTETSAVTELGEQT
jgi:glycosyltransferase involved in cell wall biosynthesis